nr:MAG TPA: Golgi reassembly-stacking protein 1, Golgin fold six-stranded anti parallel-barrel.96A [Bacteriophage sp.]
MPAEDLYITYLCGANPHPHFYQIAKENIEVCSIVAMQSVRSF